MFVVHPIYLLWYWGRAWFTLGENWNMHREHSLLRPSEHECGTEGFHGQSFFVWFHIALFLRILQKATTCLYSLNIEYSMQIFLFILKKSHIWINDCHVWIPSVNTLSCLDSCVQLMSKPVYSVARFLSEMCQASLADNQTINGWHFILC